VSKEEFLATLLVNVISIILGGGIVLLIIEWRRHQREKIQWLIEDATLQIDIPRAELHVVRWEISDDMTEKEQLWVLKNKLDGQLRAFTLIAEFVIRNTTQAEIVVTSYKAYTSLSPSSHQEVQYYDLETYDLILVDEIGVFTIKPYGVVPRYCVIHWSGRSSEVPSSLFVESTTSSGKVIKGKTVLNVVSEEFNEIQLHESHYRPKNYLRKIGVPIEEDDIPF
jgi:hypothetical protein